MMKMPKLPFFLTSCFLVLVSTSLYSQAFIDIEAGTAFTGYNDVCIPATTGDTISLKKDISPKPTLALRIRGGYTFADRHTVYALAAPLTVMGNSMLARDLTYQGITFKAGTLVESRYQFDSYRLTYRYSIVKNDIFHLGAGITAKIRNADIAIMNNEAFTHRSNLGIVPLINFVTQLNFTTPFSVLLDGDVLVTPFGRAEDVLMALQFHPSKTVTFRAGYRVLEGGSDGGGNVYTFALFNYATAGITVLF